MRFLRFSEDEGPWGDNQGEYAWNPVRQDGHQLECFDTEKRVLVGRLYLPNGQVNEYIDEPVAFGFGRYLESQSEEA